ncbi:glycosyltransferase [Labedella endophytica]|uniref:Glycosyltransferase n=1 Tax=Labedella endophytica TaxID=1523160 RepID=A0A433JPU4_9MICO|nr:glycosyltransferase [Labedella endophytica]RUQ98294.1 glycosyltransferase [Labedella endophytica]
MNTTGRQAHRAGHGAAGAVGGLVGRVRRSLGDGVRASKGLLPGGRHLALTWSITDDYGGMTAAMLARTRAFVRHGGVSVDVLTLDEQSDYAAREARLRERGEFIDGMRLLNLWDWLRTHPLPGGSLRLDRHPFAPLPVPPGGSEPGRTTEVRRGETVLSRSLVSPEGERVVQTDHYRLDGTLLLSDRRDPETGARSLVLCDASGSPARSWGRIWHLYAAWLDRLTRRRRTYLIVDSKTVAPFVAEYRRPHVTTVHLVHASHLIGSERPLGRLRESRKKVFGNLDAFDAVAVLSERQRSDVEALLGRHPGLIVARNVREGVLLDEAPARPDAAAGVMLASLEKRKRVSHAIRGIAGQHTLAAARPGAGPLATLDVFGEGPRRPLLEAVVDETGVGDSVRLHGFDAAARDRLATASFLLLTSTSEGFPLVLPEALAVGCLPIVYDVPYGPADIIRSGWNGFVVPAGDVDALAGAIDRLVTLPSEELDRMRRNAIRSAGPFEPGAVTRAWARDLRAARRRGHRRR